MTEPDGPGRASKPRRADSNSSTVAGAADGTSPTVHHGPAADLDAPAGVVVGELLAARYLVTALLGRGGMGEVYEVHDTELDEDVALKLLRAELSRDGTFRARLRSEVRLARRVSHPNVCRVHDLGQHREHLFVTMELVRGRTLRELLRDLHHGEAPPMALATVIDVVVQLSSALAAAHRVGVLHRDVKPDNVILENGRAVLTDFGIASQAGDGDQKTIAGTPSYVAPEVLRGEPFDQRSDVYAASVVAYELIAGRLPFQSRTMDEALRRAMTRTPTPALPEACGPPSLRAALEQVLGAGLEPDPGRRLAAVDRLAEGLAAALRGVDGEIGGTRPLGPSPDAGPPPPPGTEAGVTPTTTLARRPEVRVATVLSFHCDQLRAGDATLAILHRDGELGSTTQIMPIELPGDDLERLVVSLGGQPLVVTDRSLTALFGAPVALGDDAIRAVRAARSLIERSIGGRAGLDTVRLMLRPGSADPVSPDVVRLANALAGAAPPGDVWVSAAAARQIAAHVDVVSVHDVAGQRALRIAGAGGRISAVTPASLVRPRELARLEAAARTCFEQRTPTFVEVRGAPGSGKSRLRDALIARISERREVDWLVARAAPLGEAAPLSLLRTADPAWVEAALRAGPGDRGATLVAARRWLESRATRRPVAVVFEDVQWADELSRALIVHLALHLDAVPVLVVTLARDDGAPGVVGAQRITLGPLDDDTALRLARQVAPATADDLLADVVARAGGNPFFVEELARELAERGAGHASLPHTVEAAVQARLDRLSPQASDVVAAAAVVGRTFWREAALGALPAPLDDGALDAALAELERRGLCQPAPPATVDDDRYEFAQAVVRDVAYQRLPPRDRRRAHGQVARWLEARAGGTRSPDPDVLLALAHHREHGGELEAAAAAWRVAGERCLALFAYRQAHAALRRAWDLAGGVAAGDGGLAELVGDAALEGDSTEAADEALRAALDLADDGAAATRARLLHKLGQVASLGADHARAIAWFERGLALVAPGGELTAEARRDPRQAALLLGDLGWLLSYQLSSGDPRGLASCERAVELLEQTPHRRALAKALSRLGGAYQRAGRWNEQLRCNERNLEIAQELADLPAQITARVNLGVCLGNLGEVDAAIAHTEEAQRLCRRTGARVTEGLAASNLGGYLLDRNGPGDLDAAERWLSDGVRLLERAGSRRVLPEAYTFAARTAARRGDLAGALRWAQAAVALSRELEVDLDLAMSLRVLGQVEARRDQLGAAHLALEEASIRLGGGDAFELARLDAARARVRRRAGEATWAEAAVARAAAVFTRLGARIDLAALDDPDDVR